MFVETEPRNHSVNYFNPRFLNDIIHVLGKSLSRIDLLIDRLINLFSLGNIITLLYMAVLFTYQSYNKYLLLYIGLNIKITTITYIKTENV